MLRLRASALALPHAATSGPRGATTKVRQKEGLQPQPRRLERKLLAASLFCSMASDEDSSIISLTSSVADDAEGSHNGDEDSDGDLARGLARVAIDGDEPEVIDLISDDDERAEPTKAPAADEGSSDGSPRPDIVVRRRRVVESSDESEPPASPRASEHDSCSGQENAAATPPGGTAVVRRRRVVESSDDSDSPVCPRAGEDQDDSDEESGPATPARRCSAAPDVH